MLLHFDLEDWEYFLNRPEEELGEGKTIFIENINLGQSDLELIKSIKNKQSNSITELAKIINKDIINVQRKINTLEQKGLISFEQGTKNRKIPTII
ncbi:MAG: MarR family transcriptional regulator [Methanobrevibacter sp.]|jgi:DNA-binding MarR family transcriptional regulator|nr:MarR family transcriptional regulator [Methanobrevibacter sp.]